VIPLDRATVDALAVRASVDAETRAALAELVDTVLTQSAVARDTQEALAALETRDAAVVAVSSLPAERTLGPRAPLWHLLLALLEMVDGDARHARSGIDPSITSATWGDMGLWSAHFRERHATLGITLEVLDWSQRYLRGDLLRVGLLQWDLRSFAGCAHGFRHRGTGQIRWLARPGVSFSCGGRRYLERGGPRIAVEPDAREAVGTTNADFVEGHPIDTLAGAADLNRLDRLRRPDWDLVVSPETVMMEMHIPSDAGLDLREIVASARAAAALFQRLRPGVVPAGVFGEAWLLDPQVRALLPHHSQLAAFQTACALLPGQIPEAKTVRRLFGPDATRAKVVAAPRAAMSSLQRAAAGFLDDPAQVLCAAGGVLLHDGLDALERSLARG